MNRIVAAFVRADRVRAARIVRMRREAVVSALAVPAADRVDGREVEHDEAHVAVIGQIREHAVTRAVPCRITALRAGGHLVPGRETCGGPVYTDLVFPRSA